MVKVKWFGHAAFKVVIEGKTFLVDPWIRNPLSPVKSIEEVVKDVDYIIVTHDHGDHLG
ncbi:MAG TPA: MBL fold metallo-hydrolase, partial [Acidilobales archaeon]|nr:MBL fold metallo-hydrolase [Acidilobales archaeon]